MAGHVLAEATDALDLADLDRMLTIRTFVNARARDGLVVGLRRDLDRSFLGREAYTRCSRIPERSTELVLLLAKRGMRL